MFGQGQPEVIGNIVCRKTWLAHPLHVQVINRAISGGFIHSQFAGRGGRVGGQCKRILRIGCLKRQPVRPDQAGLKLKVGRELVHLDWRAAVPGDRTVRAGAAGRKNLHAGLQADHLAGGIEHNIARADTNRRKIGAAVSQVGNFFQNHR